MPELLDVSVVIVNYNVRDLLRDCLRSLEPDLGELGGEVWVVDNASADGSAEMVATEFPTVRLLHNAQNRGYAAANNQAIRQARGRYVLILNPDTKLPPGALLACLAEMDRHPDIGALGPKLIRADGSLDRACRRTFPSPEVAFFRLTGLAKLLPDHPRVARYNLLHVDPDTPLDVDSVCGAFMLVRREVIERVGTFDETFGCTARTSTGPTGSRRTAGGCGTIRASSCSTTRDRAAASARPARSGPSTTRCMSSTTSTTPRPIRPRSTR
jgi:GT2 family glycosyltransferase